MIRRSVLFALVIVIAVIIIAAGAAVWYFAVERPNTPPAIVFTSPAGGEQWRPGEEHAIAWNTRGIPADYRISLTIRRVPPPPLPQEGQEFDPIIFTDVPNTGSVTWLISPMYPNGTYVLGLNAYKSVPITNAVSAESAPFTITHPELSADLYPLYSRADWNASEVE